ncbi:MAG: TraB/GumN family protein [Planctomycetes bacterium]|nr:TraB/GumN family protein [Planctomycetota bacterium]MCP4770918.1 TraB/GumN family protein [Planctomycetota bacterium]MCP4862257.1 TraB/GumN family protein [Planctomycetota bacterium]
MKRALNLFHLLAGLLLLTASMAFSSCSDGTAIDNPLLWKVTGHGAEAYLFGTMHVADPRVTNLHPAADEAFMSSDAFYTEAGETTPSDAAKFATAGSLPEGMSLRKLLPPELWEELDSYLKSRDFLGAHIFDTYRPWFASLQLAQLDAMPLLEGGQALDFAMTARAKKDGKEIGAIEQIEEQIAALAIGDTADQIHMLRVTLEKLREEQAAGKSAVQRLLELYIAGAPDALWAYAMEETDLDDPVQAAAWQALLADRNVVMTSRIHEKLQAANGRQFMFAIGSLHYVGPDSVVAGLRELGYEVTRINGDS